MTLHNFRQNYHPTVDKLYIQILHTCLLKCFISPPALPMPSPAVATWVCLLLAPSSPAVPPPPEVVKAAAVVKAAVDVEAAQMPPVGGARLYRSSAPRSTDSLSPLPLDAVERPSSGPADLSSSPPATPVPSSRNPGIPGRSGFLCRSGNTSPPGSASPR
jgi:hypothetical protein